MFGTMNVRGQNSTISSMDVRFAVLGAVLEPAAALARTLSLSLDDLVELTTLAYFKELRQRGMSQSQIARRMDRSLRSIASIAANARGRIGRGPTSARSRLIRLVTDTLADGVPRSISELHALLPRTKLADLRDAATALLTQQVIERAGRKVHIKAHELNLVEADLEHRIDALRHFLSVFTQATRVRFFEPGSKKEAFARTSTFSVAPDKLPELRERIYRTVLQMLLEADADASGDPAAVRASFAMCMTEDPHDAGRRTFEE